MSTRHTILSLIGLLFITLISCSESREDATKNESQLFEDKMEILTTKLREIGVPEKNIQEFLSHSSDPEFRRKVIEGDIQSELLQFEENFKAFQHIDEEMAEEKKITDEIKRKMKDVKTREDLRALQEQYPEYILDMDGPDMVPDSLLKKRE